MSKGRIILDNRRFQLTIDRLCQQLIEDYGDFEESCIVGIQPRGVPLSDRLYKRLSDTLGKTSIQYGKLDITFYRDDFRTRQKPLMANPMEMDFLVEDKRVILVDDVLYTGRTIQAALTALQHYGRPLQVKLLALVDRRFNRHLPIQSDYIGLTVDALDEAYVKVDWGEEEGMDRILLYKNKQESE
ncbi:MAG: bifunctional pyr operon transcriptional regulator/uracil phosphoribosyltransferase PyrR [Bacteroidota bacterium]